MAKEDVKNLLEEVKSQREENPDSVLYEDSEERLHVLLYLYDLLDKAREGDNRHVSFEATNEEGFTYRRFKNSLEELDTLGYIDGLSFALGGNGFLEIIEPYDFKRWIEQDRQQIENRLDLPEDEGEEEVIEETERNIKSALDEFCNFVEEDGFLAFWDGDYPSSSNTGINSYPEEIGRGQFMAYLKGRGVGWSGREVPSGEGFQDVIHIEPDGDSVVSRIFELKFMRHENEDRHQEGIEQLKNYAEGQEVDTLYYLIFQKGDYFEDEEFESEGWNIVQKVATVRQEAPTSQ